MSKSKRKLYDSIKMNDFRDLVERYSTLYANDIAFEYEGKDGKKYKNYEKINSYVTA